MTAGAPLPLPPEVARHCQVLRLQPGDAVVLFDGRGGEWSAVVRRMGAREVVAEPLRHVAVDRELPAAATLAFGMPANDRMDGLVEKATELGAAALQPLVCARSVLTLDGDRAAKKVAHWQKVAIAAAEQCGRTRIPVVHPVQRLVRWLANGALPADRRLLLSLPVDADMVARRGTEEGRAVDDDATSPAPAAAGERLLVLSGPEGGLAPDEQAAAEHHGYARLCLGQRVLRADTAPLAALAWVQFGSKP